MVIFNPGYVKFELKNLHISWGWFTQGTLGCCPMGLAWFGGGGVMGGGGEP